MSSKYEGGLVYPGPGQVSYSSFLQLEKILDAQKLVTKSHDEMLFIVIHQTAELWMKLQIHEMRACRDAIAADQFLAAFKIVNRIVRIQGHLANAWEVLATMTPSDYLKFRDELGRSSGLQSYQYRVIEFLLGAKSRDTLSRHREYPDHFAAVEKALNEPSIYDAAVGALARGGFDIDASHLNRDMTEAYYSNASVRNAWLAVYRDTKKYEELYTLAEALVAVEDQFQTWRYRHMKTVARIIGNKMGTAGTAGVGYLKHLVDRPFFPELFEVRSEL